MTMIVGGSSTLHLVPRSMSCRPSASSLTCRRLPRWKDRRRTRFVVHDSQQSVRQHQRTWSRSCSFEWMSWQRSRTLTRWQQESRLGTESKDLDMANGSYMSIGDPHVSLLSCPSFPQTVTGVLTALTYIDHISRCDAVSGAARSRSTCRLGRLDVQGLQAPSRSAQSDGRAIRHRTMFVDIYSAEARTSVNRGIRDGADCQWSSVTSHSIWAGSDIAASRWWGDAKRVQHVRGWRG